MRLSEAANRLDYVVGLESGARRREGLLSTSGRVAVGWAECWGRETKTLSPLPANIDEHDLLELTRGLLGTIEQVLERRRARLSDDDAEHSTATADALMDEGHRGPITRGPLLGRGSRRRRAGQALRQDTLVAIEVSQRSTLDQRHDERVGVRPQRSKDSPQLEHGMRRDVEGGWARRGEQHCSMISPSSHQAHLPRHVAKMQDGAVDPVGRLGTWLAPYLGIWKADIRLTTPPRRQDRLPDHPAIWCPSSRLRQSTPWNRQPARPSSDVDRVIRAETFGPFCNNLAVSEAHASSDARSSNLP